MSNKLNNELVEIMIENPAYEVLYMAYVEGLDAAAEVEAIVEGEDFDMINLTLHKIEVNHTDKQIHVYFI